MLAPKMSHLSPVASKPGVATADPPTNFAVPKSFALAGRKVVIIVENLPVPFDRRVWLEARTLKRAGADVSVICPKGKGFEAEEEELDGVRIYRHDLPTEARGALGYLREYGAALFHEARLTWKIFWEDGIDVVHACNPPDLIFLIALPLKLFGCRMVFDHHDINPELYEAKFGRRGFFWRLMVLFERLTFMTADVSIATNLSYRDIALVRNGKAPDEVFVVRSGPDVDLMTASAPVPALKQGRRFLLGYVGVLGDQEGMDLLLESFRYIVHDLKRDDIQLTIAGSGPSLKGLTELSRTLGVSDYVTFLGRISNPELFELLSTADICVNPDRVTAMNDLSTMNKVLEYMAFSKPIVQFDVREGRYSAQEASLYAKNNDTVDFAEKIIELLGDEDRRVAMGRFGRDRVVRELSWRSQIPHLIAAYEKVLEGRGRARTSASGSAAEALLQTGRGDGERLFAKWIWQRSKTLAPNPALRGARRD